MGKPGHALKVNGVNYPISNSSYVRIHGEVSRVECFTSNEDSVQVVRIIDDEESLDFCISLKSLRYVSNWRNRIDKMIFDSEHSTSRVLVSENVSGSGLQQEFSFG